MIPTVAFAAGRTSPVTDEGKLNEAINNAGNGDTITIGASFSVNNPIKITGNKSIIIDLNQETISASDKFGKSNPHKLNVFEVQSITSGGTVTIKNGTIAANANTKHVLNIWDAGNVTLENLKLDRTNATTDSAGNAKGAPLVINGTNVTINGTLELIEGKYSWYGMNIDTNARGGSKEANVTVAADATVMGTIKVENTGDSTMSKAATLENNGTIENDVQLAPGATFKGTEPKGDIVPVSSGDGDDVKTSKASVTSKDGSLKTYPTLEEAINAAQAGETIKLMDNVAVSTGITINKANVTLDGNGKKITSTQNAGSAITVNGAEGVTIKGVTLDATSAYHGIQFYNAKNGKLDTVTVNGGTGTSVLVNGSDVEITNCKLNPVTGISNYATIEYGMGSGVTTIPKITLNTVTSDSPLKVWADNATVNRVIENSGGDITTTNVAQSIVGNITTTNTKVVVSVETVDDETPVDTTIDTTTPTTPSDPGGGTSTPSVTKDRVSGANRFQTAINVANELKGELGIVKFNNIVVANSDDYADALSATALAADKKAPILVVNENNESTVKNYIASNLVNGGNVYIIGGTAAVSEKFEDSLTGYKVTRLGGADRFATNIAVLKALGVSGASDIMVAYGFDFADALSASATGEPVLLVGKTLTADQLAYIKTLGGNDDYYVIGGISAVNTTVMNQLKAAKVGDVTRLAGDDRYETGLAVAEEFFGKAKTVVVASGNDFPDGLTGGVLANAMDAPLLLVNQYNTADAADFVDDNNVKTVVAIGGTTAISNATLNKVA